MSKQKTAASATPAPADMPTPHRVRFKGIPIALGDKTFVFPPLNLGALEQLQERLQNFSADTSPESISVVIDAALASLVRNYPEITRAEVVELIDLGNMLEIFQAVMDISGLRRKALEEQEKENPSAPEVAADVDPLTGENSTPT
ncbi:hypothetical protein [Microbulbifer sp. 2205BS26-8]|uniref:hypothetical protein n=1 Tax=Microbulbifer sp. 2205BS26-8 TaxID=3064386 RepID=UPI00273F2C37|nr:hypothetical protein [Microbulbifer sp. 2205BS26-8]MDP5209994.1 hypothetical protein [Microbulbifer sp. 2205BS26-8]